MQGQHECKTTVATVGIAQCAIPGTCVPNSFTAIGERHILSSLSSMQMLCSAKYGPNVNLMPIVDLLHLLQKQNQQANKEYKVPRMPCQDVRL